MKIAVIFDQAPQEGGAFHQSMNAIRWLKKACGDLFNIEIYHLKSGGVAYLNKVDLISTPLRNTMTSMIVESAIRSSSHSTRRRLKLMSPREKHLIAKGVDLVYFPSPSPFALCLQVLKYVVTVYDMSHRDFPEFPESAFEAREAYNRRAVARAVLTIVDSEELKMKFQRIYGLADDRILVAPFTPSDYVRVERCAAKESVLQKYDLENEYLFYPAQFWAHKNHVRIIQALHLLKQRGRVVEVVFAGSDKGGAGHVSKVAADLGVSDQVHFLGFVPAADLAPLYKGSLALVMPTYFGPTNLPPLEAWSFDVPVIYSKHLSAGIDDAVLAVDPDDPKSVAEAIEKVIQEEIRQKLVTGGRRCLANVEAQAKLSAAALRSHLERLKMRRETWS
jgi:glycosyltransferase involved in cell wall biosynthesis